MHLDARLVERATLARNGHAVDTSSWGRTGEAVADSGDECGLRAGESLKFEFSLGYQAEELRTEPISIVFSDGRTGIASW